MASSDALLSQFKPSEHAVVFENPFSYYHHLSDAMAKDLLGYKVPGRREQIRQGLFDYMCTKDVDDAAKRVASGEAAYLVSHEAYHTMEGTFREGRSMA